MSASATPRVSVITPAYNAERFIGHTLDSVLAQTFGDLEVLVVDDVSKDGTRGIVESYATRDARVRLIRHEQNGGPAEARNTALKAARGRYIAFLDSDDLWTEAKLKTQLAFMEEQDCAFTLTSYRRISEQGDVISGLIPVPSSLDYEAALRNTAIATSTVLLDRSMTGPFEMMKTYYDDYTLWLRLLKQGIVARGVPEDLARYRIVKSSWSRNKLRSAWQVWRVYRRIERLSFLRASRCFIQYAWNAVVKYSR
jgi:teichuronic acid biosynthesis glycosyltransferase TuaG